MNEHELPEGTVGAEHLGVRVFCISASDAQQLADQLALVLGEHMASDDEMHLTYNAIQSGWQHDPGRPAGSDARPTPSCSSNTPRCSFYDRRAGSHPDLPRRDNASLATNRAERASACGTCFGRSGGSRLARGRAQPWTSCSMKGRVMSSRGSRSLTFGVTGWSR